MAKADNNETDAATPPENQDKMLQLTPYDVLNAVSKAAQNAAKAATGNETRDAFIAFNRSLIEQFRGTDVNLPVG